MDDRCVLCSRTRPRSSGVAVSSLCWEQLVRTVVLTEDFQVLLLRQTHSCFLLARDVKVLAGSKWCLLQAPRVLTEIDAVKG